MHKLEEENHLITLAYIKKHKNTKHTTVTTDNAY